MRREIKELSVIWALPPQFLAARVVQLLRGKLRGSLRGKLHGLLPDLLRGKLHGFLRGKLQDELQGSLLGKLRAEGWAREKAGVDRGAKCEASWTGAPAFKINRGAARELISKGAGAECYVAQAREVCAHRFDLLGSGPVEVGLETEAQGFHGYRYAMAPDGEEVGRRREEMVRLSGPLARPVTGPVSGPLAGLVSKPVAEPGSESGSEPGSESGSEPGSESEPVSGPLAVPVTGFASRPVSESLSEPGSEPVSEPEPESEPRSGPLVGEASFYRPIDWHLDFKSGYRWDPQLEARRCEIGPRPGADVKVPWELSRFQHLSALGLAALVEGEEQQRFGHEFVLQVTDWIAANPYPYGINWRCTMDVAIRAVNWLWGWVFFQDHPALSAQFKALLAASLEEHGHHIEANLEYVRRGYHGNHYLAGIVGLLYLGVFMPAGEGSARRLAFALQELVEEMKHQVYADGVCFEGSVAYHRLVAECFYSATAVVLQWAAQDKAFQGNVTWGKVAQDEAAQEKTAQESTARGKVARENAAQDKAALKMYDHRQWRHYPRLRPYAKQEYDLESAEIFPGWYYAKLEKMAEYILHITKACGRTPQFGDSDSGRLHKFTPALTVRGEGECGDHRHILAVAGKLFGREDFAAAGADYALDAELLLGGGTFVPVKGGSAAKNEASGRNVTVTSPVSMTAGLHASEDNAAFRHMKAAEFTLKVRTAEGSATALPQVCSYPQGGVTVYKSALYYLAIACIPAGLGGLGAHNHNDLLSFELNVQGEDFIVDGGSYVYSADPEARNAFRATGAHSTVLVRSMEQRPISGRFLFALPEKAGPTIIEAGKERFLASHSGYGFKHYREVIFARGKITVRDYLEQHCRAEQILNLAPGVQIEGCGEERVYLKSGAVQVELSGTGITDMRVEEGFYSPCYGIRVANKRLVILMR